MILEEGASLWTSFAERDVPSAQDAINIGGAFGLPPLSIILQSSLSDPRTEDTLRAITAAFREHRGASSRRTALRTWHAQPSTGAICASRASAADTDARSPMQRM